MRKGIWIVAVCLVVAGCAGPNKLTRGLDERLNQLYVDSPLLGEAVLPVGYAGSVLAQVADWCFVNPWYFWNDVRVGRGTVYYYNDPVAPENPLPGEGMAPDAAAWGADSAAGGSAVAGGSAGSAASMGQAPSGTGSGEAGKGNMPYTVKSGDTLISIARKYYSDGAKWKRIYMANQTVLSSPDALEPGQVLVIPSGR